MRVAGPAAAASLRIGSRIVAVNGMQVTSCRDDLAPLGCVSHSVWGRAQVTNKNEVLAEAASSPEALTIAVLPPVTHTHSFPSTVTFSIMLIIHYHLIIHNDDLAYHHPFVCP